MMTACAAAYRATCDILVVNLFVYYLAVNLIAQRQKLGRYIGVRTKAYLMKVLLIYIPVVTCTYT